MRYRPFLSHKREQAATIEHLKQQLCLRGAGGWRDQDDLRLGGDFAAELRDAIDTRTGGFIWWGTRDTLDSKTICEIELPAALARARRDQSYPVIPVFVELTPKEDAEAIAAAIGSSDAKQLLQSNGVEKRRRESRRALAVRAARSYVTELVKSVPPGPIAVEITAFRAPTENHDLTLDWRSVFDDDARAIEPGALRVFEEALADIRAEAQGRERCPAVSLELSLPLPLAMLVGHQWRWTTQLRTTIETVNPATGQMLRVQPSGSSSITRPELRATALPGTGPMVLALSVGPSLGETVERYAAEVDARGFEHLHVPCDFAKEPLDAADIRGLAAHVVGRLNRLQAEGKPKHLLMRAPANLAAAIGLAGNGIGPTWVPLYDGHEGYSGGITIG